MTELKKRLIVIYNPFSGKKNTKQLPKLILSHLNNNNYQIEIWPTEKASDLTLFADKAVKTKADIIVAAGGDGTINQIAARLVNSNIALGIIPLGSGNGFARHFNLPLNTIEAIKVIPKLNTKTIDTVWFNEHCMVNIGGVGFDAFISSKFSEVKKRGLQGYVKVIAKNLFYKSQYYKLSSNGKLLFEGKAFMISFANATQWGNNIKVLPGAKPDDGLIDVVVIKEFKAMHLPSIIKSVLTGKLHVDKHSLVFTGTDFEIEREYEGPIHTDGEPIWLKKNFNIRLEPLSLNILSNEK